MRTRFVAYNRLGARRGVLTHIMQAEIVPSKNELPTLTLTYPRSTPTHRWLLDSPEVAFEYWHPLGQNWVEPKNARFKLVTQDFDYLEEVETRNYTFIGIGEALKGVYVFGPNGLKRNEEGKIQFANATPGEMLAHVWDYAVKRGWKGFSRSFSATVDSRPSAGQAWKNRMSISFAEDTSLESMLNYFSRMGLIDFEWEGRTLHVYNADTTMARDLSTGNNPVRFNLSGGRASVDAAPEANDHENLATHVVVTGENSLRWIFPTGLVLPEGRREVFLSYSGVDDEGTAQILAAPTIAKYSNSLKNTTRQFQISESTKLFPLLDYGVGDWVLVEKDDAQWERVQIFQLALLINQNGVQGYVSLGDKIDSLLERLNEAVQRVQGGSVNEGTEPPTPSAKEPSAPYGLVATARTVYSLKGEAKAVIGVNFAHSGLDVHGDPVAIDTYRVMYRKAEGAVGLRGWRQLFTISAPEQAGTHSYLDVMDHLGNLLTYEFEVIAVSSRGQESRPSSHVSLEMKYDAVPPKKPAKPTIKVSLAVFEIGTNHRTTTGSLQDIDYAHSIVEMATTPEGPWVERETIVPPSKSAWIGGEGYTTRWFRLVAVDWEGNRSEPSEAVNGTAKSIVDEEFILSEIDAAKVLIKNGEKILIESGVELGRHLSDAAQALADTNTRLTGPGGLTERLDDAEDTLLETRRIVTESSTALNSRLTQAESDWAATRTSLGTLRDTTIPNLTTQLGNAEKLINSNNTTLTQKLTTATNSLATAQEAITRVENQVSPLTAGLNAVEALLPSLQLSINGKNSTVNSPTDAANPGNYKLGDTWQKWTSLGMGGKLLQSWRHNGSAWVVEVMDPTYLPLIDIGQGTFGSLDGGRLTAKSVRADSLVIGIGNNLLVDPNFDDADLTAVRINNGTNWEHRTSTLDGGFIMSASTVTADINLWNARNETFTVDPTAAYALTVDYDGPDRLQAYMYVEYQDGSVSSGPFIRSFPFTSNARTSSTVQWDFNTISRPASGVAPLKMRVILRRTAGDALLTRVYSARFVNATKGEVIVNGTITGDHVDAQSVAAKVGTFVKVNVENITATGNANFNEAVANKMFVNMFATNKLTTNQLMVGKGENLIPWFANAEFENRSLTPHFVPSVATWSLQASAGRGDGPHAYINVNTATAGTRQEVFRFQSGVKARNGVINHFDVEADTKYKAVVWVKAGGTYSGTMPKIQFHAQTYMIDQAYEAGSAVFGPAVSLTWSWQKVELEFTTKPAATSLLLRIYSDQVGVIRLDDPMLVKDGASLIATGGIVADHIEASEAMSAKLGKFLKVELVDLVATGTANLNEAVVEKLFTNIFATKKLTANQVYIGDGGNIFPTDLTDPAWQRATGVQFFPNGGKLGGSSILLPATTTQIGTYFAPSLADRLKAPKLIPGQTYKVSANVRGNATIAIGGASIYMRLYAADSATAYSWTTPSNTGNDKVIPANTWGVVEGMLTVPEGATDLYAVIGLYAQGSTNTPVRFSDLVVQEAVTHGLIVDNGILARHIEASESMSAKIGSFLKLDVGSLTATGTSTLDTAVINNLWANVVRSRSITTDMLLVGKGANLIPNGDLANGKDGWSNAFGIYVDDPSSKALGFPAALWYLGNGTANSPTFSLKGGTTYQFSMYARGNVSGKRFYVQLITDNANAASPHLVQNQLTYTAIRQYEAEVTVEAGVTSAYLRIFANHVNGDTTEGHQWFSGFEMYEKNAASLIVTGGIVTKHLKVTEDMTAALLRVKKVEAGEINFNSLFGDTGFIGSLRTTVLTTNSITSDLITANAITSKHTLTGPLIRTAASGARTEITRDGLRTVNAAGQELVKIGYGIETGISLRNPANNTLTPISAMVFGVALSRTSPIYPASMAKVGDSVSLSPSPGDIFTAAGSRAVMLVSVNGYSGANGAPPGGVTGNVMVEPPVVRVKAALKLVGSAGAAPSTWGAQVAYLNPGIVISGSGESYSSTISFSVEINSLLVGRDYEVWVGFEYLKAPVVLNSSTNNMTFPSNVPVNVQTQIVVIPR